MPPGAATGTHNTALAAQQVSIGGDLNYYYTGPAPCGLQPARSNIPALYKRDFVGRREELTRLGALLADPGRTAAVVLHGPPGAGKTELAYEYARRHAGRYPGGCFMVDAGGGTPVALAEIGQRIFGLTFPPDLTIPGQCERTLVHVSVLQTLLIYDNARSPDLVEGWLPAAGAACHVIITSLGDDWDGFCHEVPVAPLADGDCLDLIAGLTDRGTSERHGAALIAASGGFPVQLVPATTALSKALRRGRSGAAALALKPETESSFRVAYDALDPPAQLLLHTAAVCNGQRLDQTGLETDLAEATGWDHDTFLDHRDACLDLHLLDGGASLRMHHLIATFVLGQPPPNGMREMLQRVRQGQWDRLLAVADALGDAPARTGLASELARFRVDPLVWDQAGIFTFNEEICLIGRALLEIGQFEKAYTWWILAFNRTSNKEYKNHVSYEKIGFYLHQIGFCLSGQQKFNKAQEWYEQAVKIKLQENDWRSIDYSSVGYSLHCAGYCLSRQRMHHKAEKIFKRAVIFTKKGDIYGRIDQTILGRSLHQVGFCLSRQEKYAEAEEWFLTALKSKEKGNLHGQINHASIGRSMHEIGFCLSEQSNYTEAQKWYIGATEKKALGDIHGRVDLESLSSSLHQIGVCLFEQKQHNKALEWFQRSVEAAEKGDIHGRVDRQSLALSVEAIGHCLSRQGHPDQAAPWFERAEAARAQAAKPDESGA